MNTTEEYYNQVNSAVAALKEHIIQIYEWDEGDDGISTDIKFRNPVTGNVSMVSFYTDYDDTPILFVDNWEARWKLQQMVAIANVNELFKTILTSQR
jgi:hypothetical protein